ncbi:RNA-guided endonuclease InsQ/TnpB family protein [Neptuniibacter sp. QD37_11]|uniref:RNA-guided endonuclease InsQ/TnpB family protein n=1 Tax=Neptuniibacter sp. QD37_11 TaxID=3398209 RepID=UPI0039F484A4
MLIRKAFQYQLKTMPEIEQMLFEQAAFCRFVWNKALELNLRRLKDGLPLLWFAELCFWLKLWKSSEELGFLKAGDSQALQQRLKDLDRAFKDGFDKQQPNTRIPIWRKKGKDESFRIPQRFKFEGNRVYIPKIGWVGFRNSRKLEGKPKNLTVSYRAGKWYISVQCEIEISEPQHPSRSIVGIDLGVKRFATLSNGVVYEPLNSFKKHQQKLKREQQNLARKVKFSANWQKQKARIARLHSKIADCRKDHLHKITTKISNNHAMIIIEDLQVRNMSKSAKGTQDSPGSNVRQKSGLNRSILDQAWSETRRQLEYKQQWKGGDVLAINPARTSQTCSCCGHIDPASRVSQALFSCTNCGKELNADDNAALNILAAGHAVLACGEPPLGSSMKQEPVQSRKSIAAYL